MNSTNQDRSRAADVDPTPPSAPRTALDVVIHSRALGLAIPILGLLMVAVSAVRFAGPTRTLTDFHAFYLAGWLALHDRLGESYHALQLFAAQRDLYAGAASFMPWTYPPPFNLVCEQLARLPLPAAYVLFSLTGGIAYLSVLRALAGPAHVGAVLLIAPAYYLNLRTGQNGLWTGTLIGLWAWCIVRSRPAAGVALGMMIIKPHLAVGPALATLATRRWRLLTVAAATAAALAAAATLAYGVDVWRHFAAAAREASIFLREGLYPLHRMASLYSTLRASGVPAAGAMTAQVLSAIFGLSLIAVGARWQLSARAQTGMAVLASLFFSPYLYDYDLTLLGIALALLLDDFRRLATRSQQITLFATTWLATGFGLVTTFFLERGDTALSSAAMREPSPASPASLLVAFVALLMLLVFRRARRDRRRHSGVNAL